MSHALRAQNQRRILLDPRERRRFPRSSLTFDAERTRPHYFDGKLLTARDLLRDQAWFLDRLGTLGRALGTGVVEGLEIEGGEASDALVIKTGFGLTPGGELVGLDEDLDLRLRDIALSESYDAAFGLRRRPRSPARARSGAYVIGLRAVEFTANPVASYPTSLEGERSVRDGDVVEATAVVLVPFPDPAGLEDPGERRARLAREIFFGGAPLGLPTAVLPLAMVGLERGEVLFLDIDLVRRQSGHDEALGLDARPRGMAEAYLRQYARHLEDVLDAEQQAGRGRALRAAEHFEALPAAGPMPSAAVDPVAGTQRFLPPGVETELTLVPIDELPALIEDSLSLPGFDLSQSDSTRGEDSALLLVPVERSDIPALMTALEGAVPRPLLLDLSARLALSRPIDRLRELSLRLPQPVPVPSLTPSVAQQWSQLIAATPMLFFLRRRRLRHTGAMVSESIPILPPAGEPGGGQSDLLVDALREIRLGAAHERVRNSLAPELVEPYVDFVGSSEVIDNRLIVANAITTFDRAASDGEISPDFLELTIKRHLEEEIQVGHKRVRELSPKTLEETTPINNLTTIGALPYLTLAARMRGSAAEEVLAGLHELASESGPAARENLQAKIEGLLEEFS